MITTTPSTAQAELANVYRRELHRFHEFTEAIRQIVDEDFPAPDARSGVVTRWHVDALRGMSDRLSALIEGYERGA
jgi:hypothetical protein